MTDLRGIPILGLGAGEVEVDGEPGFTPGARYPLLGIVVDNDTLAARVLTVDDDRRLRHVPAVQVRIYRPVRQPPRVVPGSAE